MLRVDRAAWRRFFATEVDLLRAVTIAALLATLAAILVVDRQPSRPVRLPAASPCSLQESEMLDE